MKEEESVVCRVLYTCSMSLIKLCSNVNILWAKMPVAEEGASRKEERRRKSAWATYKAQGQVSCSKAQHTWHDQCRLLDE